MPLTQQSIFDAERRRKDSTPPARKRTRPQKPPLFQTLLHKKNPG